MSSVALVLALTLVGQTPSVFSGKVRETNAGVLLESEDKVQVTLHGATAADDEELKRLTGVKVKITATAIKPDHVRVEHYEILDVGGGVVPRIGRIAQLELAGKTRLLFVDAEGMAELLPESWIKKMQKHVGAKIWIAGNRSETKGELVPQRFAILRTKSAITPEDGP